MRSFVIRFDPLKIGSALEGKEMRNNPKLAGFDPLKIGSALEGVWQLKSAALWF